MRQKILHDEKGDDEICGAICGGIIAIGIILTIIYYVIMIILSILTQILIIAIILFVVYRIYSKHNAITKWIQPDISPMTMTEQNISNIIFLNIFFLAPIYNKYTSENMKYIQLKTKIKKLSEGIINKSASINEIEKEINKLKNRTDISSAIFNEIDILDVKKTKEKDSKIILKNELINSKNLLTKKQDELRNTKEIAYSFIIKQKKDDGRTEETVVYGDDETRIY